MNNTLPPFIAPLFVPGNRPDRFAKAAMSGTSAIIIDFEDAVAEQDKDQARAATIARSVMKGTTLVRINAATTPFFQDDLNALKQNPPDGILIAKAETRKDLHDVQAVLGSSMSVIPLIESARGLANLPDILQADNISSVAFGSLDFALDIGCEHVWDALLLARCEIVLRCRLADIAPPVDGVTTAIDNPELIEYDARRARDIGFGGKLAIHPKQIAPIRGAFSFTQDDIAWATRVISALEGSGAQQIDGKMIDRPVIARAQRILAQSS